MRITFVAPSAYPSLVDAGIEFAGGAEFQQISLARWLRDRGHRISFVVADHGQAEMVESDGFRLFRSFELAKGNRKLRFVGDMMRLREAIHRSEPQMVNQRSTSFYTGQSCLFSHEAGAAFSFSLGIDYNCYPDLQGRASWPIPSFYRWGVEHAELVLAQTRTQSSLMAANFDCEPVVTPNVLEIPPLGGELGGDGYLLWVGSLARRKRPELFLELARALPDRRFVLVGGPGEDPGYDEEMRVLGRELGNLDWRGFVPPDEMPTVYRDAALLVGTSRLEGLPNTYLQSWSHGVPVLSVSVDPDGAITEKALGELVGEEGDLMARAEAWMADAERRARAGSAGHEHVSELHDIDRVGPRVEELFERAVDARG